MNSTNISCKINVANSVLMNRNACNGEFVFDLRMQLTLIEGNFDATVKVALL